LKFLNKASSNNNNNRPRKASRRQYGAHCRTKTPSNCTRIYQNTRPLRSSCYTLKETDVEALGALSAEPALFLFFFLPLCCLACSSCSNNCSCCCNFRLSRSDFSTPNQAPSSMIPAMGVMSRLVGLLREEAEADRASVFSSSGSFVLTASLPALSVFQ